MSGKEKSAITVLVISYGSVFIIIPSPSSDFHSFLDHHHLEKSQPYREGPGAQCAPVNQDTISYITGTLLSADHWGL